MTLDCLERATPLSGPPARFSELLELEFDISPCVRTGELKSLVDTYLNAVLWIRIRLDPKLFAGSGSGIIIFGSGFDKLQFSLAKIACNLLSK